MNNPPGQTATNQEIRALRQVAVSEWNMPSSLLGFDSRFDFETEGRSIAKRAGPRPLPIDELVNDAAVGLERYPRQYRVVVTLDARRKLVLRANQHLEDIWQVFDEGDLGIIDLRNAAFKQLLQAVEILRQKRRGEPFFGTLTPFYKGPRFVIRPSDVGESLALKCWFVGWC